jgi:outer membrane lipoprotein-sorting protein
MKKIIMNKKIIIFLLCSVIGITQGFAITAKQVLDKTAATLSNKSGISANFTMSGTQYGNVSGVITVKGRKFHASTPVAVIWFDGKTQWTYMKKNDEVNVSTPNEAQLQAINPYNFIHLYKSGFSYTMTTQGTAYVVHLTATGAKSGIQEMYITVNKKSYVPSQVKMRQGKTWSTIDISGFKKSAVSDTVFRFNSKDYPQAEIIDLR